MRRLWNGTLHKVHTTVGPNGRVLRYCENCGATWEMVPYGDFGHAYRPVKELDQYGKELDTDVDVRECAQVSGATGSAPASAQAPAASVAPQSKPANLCYCPMCKVKKQHFDGNDNCFCVRCQGKHPHKSAA
jgi:hypothetical protein